MTITLQSNPPDAPCCVKIIAQDGRDLLIQTDWEWPAVATTFGWSIRNVQHSIEDCDPCEHRSTDGTVKCDKCGMPVSLFLKSARQWIDDNDGATAEDPGYFDTSEYEKI